MDLVILQMCYDGWWKTLAIGRMEYINAMNKGFLFRKIVHLISCLQEYIRFYG